MPKLHELTGQITNKELRKVYNKNSPYYGNANYKLTVITTINDRNNKDFIFAYLNIVSPEIFKTIAQSQYLDKRYLFFCERKPKRWVLHKWEELPNKSENHDPKP